MNEHLDPELQSQDEKPSVMDATINRDIFSRVIHVAIKVLLGSGFSKLCLVGAEFFLAAFLGAAGYGLFAMAFAFLLVISVLTQLGLNFGVIQYISIYTERSDEQSKAAAVRGGLSVTLVVSVLCAVIIYFSSEWLAVHFFNQPGLAPILLIVAFIIPFEALNQTFSAIFRGLRKFRYHVLAQDLIRNLSLLACVPLLLTGVIDSEGIFVMLCVGAVSGSIFSLCLMLSLVPLFQRGVSDLLVLRELLSFSYLLFFWQALQKTANELMVLIAGTILASAEVGVLALSVRFLTLLNFPQTVINATTPVEFARFNHRQEYWAITKLFQLLALILSLISLGFAFVVGLNANWFFPKFGPGYESFGWVLHLLLVAKVIDVGGGPVGQILIACRKRRTVFMLGLLDVVLQFFFVVPLMYYAGLIGAAVGNTLRSVAIVSARHLSLYFMLKVYAVSKTLIILLLTGAGIFAIGLLLIETYNNTMVNIATTIATTIMLALLMVFTWRNEPHFSEAISNGLLFRAGVSSDSRS